MSRKYILTVIFILLIIGALAYLGYRYYVLLGYSEELTERIAILETDLEKTQNERDIFLKDLIAEQQRVGTLANQVNKITGAVGELDKLSKTDKELLQKYSKVYFLNEHYTPSELFQIDSQYLNNGEKDQWMHAKILPYLTALLDSARKGEIDIEVLSGYRSFDTQTVLKSSYSVVYGAGTANQFSADQGYSEHQLGTTVDFTTSKISSAVEAFDKSDAYKWLTNNAHRFGFILSYPKDNTYYNYEPWHWRFVGKDLAQWLYDEDRYFYDVDQRKIDEYLVSFFD